MGTSLIPQEIFLLERYSSVDYFGLLRDVWAEMITHLDHCLDEFLRNLPPDYRNRPLPEQPDAVWGEHVIPNFRDTLQSLNDGYSKLLGGDVTGLEYCHGPLNAFKGQTDFWAGWMSRADENVYGELLNTAVIMAGNIRSTIAASWKPMTLSSRYDEQLRGTLNAPVTWPAYRLAPGVAPIASGDKLSMTGIYLPDVDNSCAEFLSADYEIAPQAKVYVGEKDMLTHDTAVKYGQQPIYVEKPCNWRLVIRTDDTYSASRPNIQNPSVSRVPAGTSCPKSGYYFTPARENSRTRFAKGEVMPKFDSEYGATIWQWDNDQ